MIFTPALPMYVLVPVLFVISAVTVYSFIKVSRQGRKQILKTAIRTVGVLILCLAVLRPAIPTIAEIEKLGTNLDIYFVLDTTASMGVEDITADPESISRLQLAKNEIESIAEDNIGAKYSLLTFDTTAKVEIPLVRDLSALKSTLDIISPQPFLEGISKGTNTMMVVPALEEVLAKAHENSPERVKVVYYITDGEDTDYDTGVDEYDLSKASELADERYVIGVGSEEGGDIPLYTFDETFTEIIQDGYYDGISSMVAEQIEFIAENFNAEPPVFIDDSSESFPPVASKTVEEKLSLVDKNSPAQFEFYWILAIVGGLLLIVDMNSLYSQIYRLIRGRIYT